MDYVKNSEQYSYSYPVFVVLFSLGVTVEEAAAYSNIGINKINRMLDEPSCNFILQVGKGKRLVKRKEFEKYLLKTSDITDI